MFECVCGDQRHFSKLDEKIGAEAASEEARAAWRFADEGGLVGE